MLKSIVRRQVQKMNNLFQKGQSILNKYIGFFLLAVFFLWMKTYIVQLTQFDLGLENTIQQFLLFINPLGSSLLFLGICILYLKDGKNILPTCN